jgi:hypothetical protein
MRIRHFAVTEADWNCVVCCCKFREEEELVEHMEHCHGLAAQQRSSQENAEITSQDIGNGEEPAAKRRKVMQIGEVTDMTVDFICPTEKETTKEPASLPVG